MRALIQSITFNEFLPALLGEDAIEKYTGYDLEVNPGAMNSFSTVGFRFGHSAVKEYEYRICNERTSFSAYEKA